MPKQTQTALPARQLLLRRRKLCQQEGVPRAQRAGHPMSAAGLLTGLGSRELRLGRAGLQWEAGWRGAASARPWRQL